MRKSLLVSAIAIAAVGAASPWVMGTIAEDQYIQSVELIQQEENEFFKVTGTSFERGYADSKALIKITYTMPDTEIPPFSFVIESELQHLPISVTDQGTYFFEITSKDRIYLEGIPEDMQAFIDEHLGGSLLTGNSHINLLGNGGTELKTHEVNFEDPDTQSTVQVKPLTINIDGDMASINGTAQLNLPSLIIQDQEGSLEMKAFVIDSTFAQHESGMNTGTSVLNISEMNVFSPAGPINLTNIGLDTVSEVVNDKLNTKMSYSVAKIQAPFPISAARYDIELNGLTQKSLEMFEELNEKSEEFMPASFSNDPFFKDLLEATLQPGLELNQEMEISAFGGQLFADLDVAFTGVEGVELMQLASPDLAPKAFKANFIARADNEAILSTPAAPMIAQFIEQGFVKQTDKEVSTEIKLVDGKLTVNEQEIPLESVIQGIMMKMAEDEQVQ
ncbi:DUF945 family protein [Litoribacillus peritrichatus]|uniref:DUF945 domain-containing protein n=1 Tax=Litoribacillus peritrichatus TaxID=718191 RepID=A0ABP7N5V8_9GAMM